MKVSKAFILALVTTVLACLAIACSAESEAVKGGTTGNKKQFLDSRC